MEKPIDPKAKKIGDYFKLEKKEYFIIPEYQRPYSWTKDQCDKLWQDIEDYMVSSNKESHFFGTIIISCKNNTLSLIDGQQRTITFLLLLKALLISVNNAIINCAKDKDSKKLYINLKDKRKELMCLLYSTEVGDFSEEPDEKNDKKIYSKINILKNNSINEKYPTELNNILKSSNLDEAKNNVEEFTNKKKDNRYTNYFKNFKFFCEKANELSESNLNSFTNTLLKDCEVIQIKSWNIEQAITMFNSLNADGLPLCDADIISAKLYSSSQKHKCAKEYANLWENFNTIIDELEKRKILNIDSIFLQEMYYERAKKHENKTTTPGVRKYFTYIKKEFISNPITSCKNIINLAKIWEKISYYPTLEVLFKFNENFKLFLATFLYRFDEKKLDTYEPSEKIVKNKTINSEIDTIIICMLRLFTVLELVETGYSSKQFKGFLFNVQSKLVDKNVSVEEIKSDFDKHIKSNWTKEKIIDYIGKCNSNSLVYLNEFLFAREQKINFNLGTTYDIEHIMPNSGRNKELIRNDAKMSDKEEFEKYVDKIGNKILLEYNINRSIGDSWFRTKVSTSINSKTGYKDSKFPMAIALVKEYQNKKKVHWVKEDIINYTNKAAERISKFIFDE